MIGAELDKKDYGSISATIIGRGLKSLDIRIDFNSILATAKFMVKSKKIN
jgi:hypothetical protein